MDLSLSRYSILYMTTSNYGVESRSKLLASVARSSTTAQHSNIYVNTVKDCFVTLRLFYHFQSSLDSNPVFIQTVLYSTVLQEASTTNELSISIPAGMGISCRLGVQYSPVRRGNWYRCTRVISYHVLPFTRPFAEGKFLGTIVERSYQQPGCPHGTRHTGSRSGDHHPETELYSSPVP